MICKAVRHTSVVFATILVLSACSGNSTTDSPLTDANPGDDTSQPTGDGTPQPVNDKTGNSAHALLPTASEPNSIGLQLVRSDDGVLHAAYSDITGRVLYSRCSGGCGQGDSWRSVVVSQFDVGFSGFVVARLELDTSARPRIACHAVPAVFDAGTTHFAQCDDDCLNAQNWESAPVIQHGGGLLEHQLAEADWFALDTAGKPVVSLLLQNGFLDTDKRLRLLSCDSNCAESSRLDDQAICSFIGTRVSSSFSSVQGALGFTASPQWACGLPPVLVTGPDGERFYDYSSDIRFLELSTVVAY